MDGGVVFDMQAWGKCSMMSPGAWWSSLGVVFDMQALGENLMKKFGAWWTGLGAMRALGTNFTMCETGWVEAYQLR